MKDWKRQLIDWWGENRSYKIIAFIITFALWLTILGRRDVVLTREFGVEFLLRPNYILATDVVRQVRVKVSGPRAALQKFASLDNSITLDLQDYPIGQQSVEVTAQALNLPLGVKVLSITPNVIRAKIKLNTESRPKRKAIESDAAEEDLGG